jgi:hypothetical protein
MNISPLYFEQTTNRESWNKIIQFKDRDTGELLDLTHITSIHVEVRPSRGPNENWDASGYGPNYGLGAMNVSAPMITADLGNGVTVIDTGTILIQFGLSKMRALWATDYIIAAVCSDGTDEGVFQLWLGTLPVKFGAVA